MTPASAVRAQSADQGAAESLFRQGKVLLEQKDYAQACPKLAESYRLDPGTGTLLALALCHEGEGRLATGWGEFADVAARSRREHRQDREDLARQHQSALEARLSTMTITIAPGADKVEKLQIKRDGVEVGSGSWATAIPVDPGHHHIEASAPGYKPFVSIVTVGPDTDRQSVIVPVLQAEPAAETAAAHGDDSRKTIRVAGFVAGGVGVVGIALGAVFGLRAISLNNDSKNGCDAQSTCSPTSFGLRNDARSAGTISTVAFIAGGALAAAGATMFLVTRKGPERTPPSMALAITPSATEHELGLELGGAF